MIKAGLTDISISWNLGHFYCALFRSNAIIQTAETHVLGLPQVSLLCYRRQLRRHHWKLFPLKRIQGFVSWFANSFIVWHQISSQNSHVISDIWLCVYIHTGIVELWETSYVVTALETLMIMDLGRLINALHRLVQIFLTWRIKHHLIQVFLELFCLQVLVFIFIWLFRT